MRYFFFVLFLFSVVVPSAAESPAGKKMIEWGWDEPDTKFIRQNVRKMEAYPFDGLVFHVVSSEGGNFTWEIWSGRKFAIEEFRHSIDDLTKNYFTPDEFEATVRSALAVSDEYVWIYTEQPRWWTNERLPTEYVSALHRAQTSNGDHPEEDDSE